MKHIILISTLFVVFGTITTVFAEQFSELDGSVYWHTIKATNSLQTLESQPNGLTMNEKLSDHQASFTSAIIKTPFLFTALGAHWQVETPGMSNFKLFISTSIDGHSFGPFRPIAADSHLEPVQVLPNGAPNPRFGDTLGQLYLHPRSDGQYFRYRLSLSRDHKTGLAPVVKRLGFSVIDARINHQQLPPKTSLVVAGGYPKPPVVSRSAWGAQPATCNYAYCSTTHIAVHHTASVSDYTCSGFSQCAATVRAIQSFHMNGNGWCDLGYNYLATADGTLWEGRGGGDDVRGAHDGHNCGSMGVSNLGFFHPPHNQLWTNEQQDAVAELSAWKSEAQDIDPFGMDFYVGLGGFNDNIYGHRDVSATACPGDNIYSFLPDLRSLVDAKLNSDEPQQIIFDTNQVNVVTDNWTSGSSSPDKYGANYLWASTGSDEICGWNIDIDAPRLYQVSLWWPAGSNRSPVTQIFVKRPRDDDQIIVDQRVNGGQWNTIGTYLFEKGDITVGVSNSAPSGAVVMCDALRLVPLD